MATQNIKTIGSVWNKFYADKTAWPEGAYHDDTLLAINGKKEPDCDYENLPQDAIVEIVSGYVMFEDGSDGDLAEHFKKWLDKQTGQGTVYGAFSASTDKLEAIRAAIVAAGGTLL